MLREIQHPHGKHLPEKQDLYFTIDTLEAELQLAFIATVLDPQEFGIVEARETLDFPHVCVI